MITSQATAFISISVPKQAITPVVEDADSLYLESHNEKESLYSLSTFHSTYCLSLPSLHPFVFLFQSCLVTRESVRILGIFLTFLPSTSTYPFIFSPHHPKYQLTYPSQLPLTSPRIWHSIPSRSRLASLPYSSSSALVSGLYNMNRHDYLHFRQPGSPL